MSAALPPTNAAASISVLDLLSRPVLHIFGYGSLIWRPGFEYDSLKLGYITGYERRFWQGSTHHRGTEQNPGRVLTAIPKPTGRIYGITYTVTGRDRIKFALEALGVRESLLGGYSCMMMDFHAVENSSTHPFSAEEKLDHNMNKFEGAVESEGSTPNESDCQVLLYVALPENPLYAGQMPEEAIGKLVSGTEGVCGPNSDYITKLADFMSGYFPLVEEPHLFSVDFFVRKFDEEKRKIAMSSKPGSPSNSLATSPATKRRSANSQPRNSKKSSEKARINLLVSPITV